jgi:hypothetical protein
LPLKPSGFCNVGVYVKFIHGYSKPGLFHLLNQPL